MIMEENWGEQEYEKAGEQTLPSPTSPPPPSVYHRSPPPPSGRARSAAILVRGQSLLTDGLQSD